MLDLRTHRTIIVILSVLTLWAGHTFAETKSKEELIQMLSDKQNYTADQLGGAIYELITQDKTTDERTTIVDALINMALDEDRPDLQAYAVSFLGNVNKGLKTTPAKHDEVVQVILSSIESEDENVRGSAIGTFGSMASHNISIDILQYLFKAAREDPSKNNREFAITAIDRTIEENTLDALKPFLKPLLTNLIHILQNGQEPEVQKTSESYDGVHSPEPGERSFAAYSLTSLSDKMMEQLTSTNVHVKRLVQAVLKSLNEESNKYVRQSVVKGLLLLKLPDKKNLFNNKKIFQKLENLITQETSNFVRGWVIPATMFFAKNNMDDPTPAKQLFINIIENESNDELRMIALPNFAEIATTSDIAEIISSLQNDSSPDVRASAAYSLGVMSINRDDVLSALDGALSDEALLTLFEVRMTKEEILNLPSDMDPDKVRVKDIVEGVLAYLEKQS